MWWSCTIQLIYAPSPVSKEIKRVFFAPSDRYVIIFCSPYTSVHLCIEHIAFKKNVKSFHRVLSTIKFFSCIYICWYNKKGWQKGIWPSKYFHHPECPWYVKNMILMNYVHEKDSKTSFFQEKFLQQYISAIG